MTATDRTIRVLQYGLGPIGMDCARTVLDKGGTCGLQLVGAVDNDPAKAGRDLGRLIGSDPASGVVVDSKIDEALGRTAPDVVLHATSSFLVQTREELESCIRAGAHVISTCEELLYPFRRHPDLSATLDELACDHGVVLLGTGVNPGFVMDALALMSTGACRRVDRVWVERVVDASTRRGPLQEKIGAGLTVERFRATRVAGTSGHIGLRESLLFVAAGLGWELDRIAERLEPVIALADLRTRHKRVQAGQVAGIHHVVQGFVEDRERIELDLKMYVGAREPHDAIRVEGDPPIDLLVRGGVAGDSATVAAVVNAIPLVLSARPGLRTMMDLSVPRAFCAALHS